MLLKTNLEQWDWNKKDRVLRSNVSRLGLNELPAAVMLNTPSLGNLMFTTKGFVHETQTMEYTALHVHSSYNDIQMYIEEH